LKDANAKKLHGELLLSQFFYQRKNHPNTAYSIVAGYLAAPLRPQLRIIGGIKMFFDPRPNEHWTAQQ
jgi:hypothetical protein